MSLFYNYFNEVRHNNIILCMRRNEMFIKSTWTSAMSVFSFLTSSLCVIHLPVYGWEMAKKWSSPLHKLCIAWAFHTGRIWKSAMSSTLLVSLDLSYPRKVCNIRFNLECCFPYKYLRLHLFENNFFSLSVIVGLCIMRW
jgi:hypothetical protein